MKSKIRVGFDAKRLFNNFTGLGNYSRFIIGALCEHYPDNEYWLYAPKVRSHPEIDAIVSQQSIKLSKPSPITSALRLESFWRSVNLGNVASKDNIQIFHGLSNELPFTKPAQLKTIVSIHDAIFERFPEFYKAIDVRIYRKKIQLACQSADKIIAISKQTEEDLIHFYKVDRSKIEVIYQGCHPNFKASWSPQSIKEVQRKYNLPSEFILSVGTIEPRKNAMSILQSLSYLKHDLPVVFVGRETSYQKKLDDYIRSKKLGKRVMFIHHAAFADLPAIYRSASVFVYPSLFEGFGIPIVEAISCDVPVITSVGSCFAEAGGPDCLYVNPKNSEQLAAGLDVVLSNNAKRDQMITNSKKYIQQFEPNVIATNLIRTYNELLQ